MGFQKAKEGGPSQGRDQAGSSRRLGGARPVALSANWLEEWSLETLAVLPPTPPCPLSLVSWHCILQVPWTLAPRPAGPFHAHHCTWSWGALASQNFPHIPTVSAPVTLSLSPFRAALGVALPLKPICFQKRRSHGSNGSSGSLAFSITCPRIPSHQDLCPRGQSPLLLLQPHLSALCWPWSSHPRVSLILWPSTCPGCWVA